MPYSLISVATLGFDLVRLPEGRRVADVLLAGLAGDADVLTRLAAQSPSQDADSSRFRTRARGLAAAAPRVFAPFGAVPTDGAGRHALLVAQLERGTVGSVANLERLIREELLGTGQEPRAVDGGTAADAADVLADAAVGYWAVEVLPSAVRRRLTAPFEAAGVPWAAPDRGGVADLGTAAEQLYGLYAELAGLDEKGRDRWRAASAARPGGHGAWAKAMHEACWAAYLSGRTGAVAAAQLHAVRAFVDGGLGPRDGAQGVWNAVAGCVQSLATADLLDSDSLAVLQAPWSWTAGQRPAA
jgi:hypothetical protein